MDTLFHYTTAAGLLGILDSSAFWATDLRFLNDAQEAVYARELFVDAVRSAENPALYAGHPAHDDPQSFGETFAGYKQLVAQELNSPDFAVYVTCFCESGDLLSQWRAYGSDHGYAIEVKTDALKTADTQIPGYGMSLMQVRYGRDAAADVVSTAMRDMTDDSNLAHVGVHAHYMALRLTAMLAGVKHPGFQEEREWRVVAAFEWEEPELARFRSTPMAIVPYIEVPLPKDAIVTIRVGPGRHVDVLEPGIDREGGQLSAAAKGSVFTRRRHREAGVRRLLRTVGCEAPVLHSEVPLRT
jgi:hypothetical protein